MSIHCIAVRIIGGTLLLYCYLHLAFVWIRYEENRCEGEIWYELPELIILVIMVWYLAPCLYAVNKLPKRNQDK